MQLAKEAASWSKDPSTKIGAVCIGAKGQVLSTGYNGFPRGIDDSLTRYYDRELKYKMVVHAEMNAIFNATYNGVSLDGSTMYVHGLPVCSDCAKGIIQVGVKRIIMDGSIPSRWKESWQLTQKMFNEANVKWEFTNVSNPKLD
jgi:dCMP deaminase